MIKNTESEFQGKNTYQNLHIVLTDSNDDNLGKISIDFSLCRKNIYCKIFCYENKLFSRPIKNTKDLLHLIIKAYPAENICIKIPEDKLIKYKSFTNIVNFYKEILPDNLKFIENDDEKQCIRCKPSSEY